MNFYVYRITDVENNMHYYGSRQSELDPNDDIGVKYFSSSSLLQEEIRFRPMDFHYKVVFKCKSRSDAYRLERKLHLKFNVSQNESFYNLVVCGSFSRTIFRAMDETRRIKLSSFFKERMSYMNKEERSKKFGSFGKSNPMIRDGGHSEKSKTKMREAQKRIVKDRLRKDKDHYTKMAMLAKTPEAKLKAKLKRANPIKVTFHDNEIKEFLNFCDLGKFLNLSDQMGSRIFENPHLWQKYNILNIVKGNKNVNQID